MKKMILLTNFIPPYRVHFLKKLHDHLENFKIFISTEMENNRKWDVDWGDLDVTLQKSITIKRQWKHSYGFSEQLYTHFPFDTIQRLNKFHPDIVITAEFGTRTLLAVIYKIFHPKCKIIIWATISQITEIGREKNRILLRKFLLKFCNAIIVNGKSGKEYIRSFGFPEKKIFTVPYPTDTALINSPHFKKTALDSFRLLFIGQIIERKGVILFLNQLIEWAKQNTNQDVDFWICGSGNQSHKLNYLNLPQNLSLTILEDVPYQQISLIYRQCGALVFPTLADEWGMVVNEAMASGLIVLGSIYSQAVEEMVEEGKNGWSFRPDYPSEIMTVLDEFFKLSQSQINFMQENAIVTAKHFSVEYAVNCMLKAIRSV